MVSLEKAISKIDKHLNVDYVLNEIKMLKNSIGEDRKRLFNVYRLQKFTQRTCKNMKKLSENLFELDAKIINMQLNYQRIGEYRYLFNKNFELQFIIKKAGKSFTVIEIDEIKFSTNNFIIDPNEIHSQNKIKIPKGIIYTLEPYIFQKFQFEKEQFNPLANQRNIKNSMVDFLDYMMLEKGGLIGAIKGFISKEKIDNSYQFSLKPKFFLPNIESTLYVPQLN